MGFTGISFHCNCKNKKDGKCGEILTSHLVSLLLFRPDQLITNYCWSEVAKLLDTQRKTGPFQTPGVLSFPSLPTHTVTNPRPFTQRRAGAYTGALCPPAALLKLQVYSWQPGEPFSQKRTGSHPSRRPGGVCDRQWKLLRACVLSVAATCLNGVAIKA